MFGHKIKHTGWQRSNHLVQIDKYDDEVFASLICPPCCPSVANEHLRIVESTNNFWHGAPLGEPQYAECPVTDRLKDDFRCPTFECIGCYEQQSIGLIDGYRGEPYGDTLDHESKELLANLPDGSYEVEIAFAATYGWSDSGPWGPSEYEWEFSWRFEEEPRVLS